MSGLSSKRKGDKYEREVARLFGGKRTPLSGAAGGNDITFEADIWRDWAMEAKRRATLPRSLMGWMDQADAAIPYGSPKHPAIVVREDNGRSIFCCYAQDLKTWAEALAEVGRGGRIRDLARELRRLAFELEQAAR